MRQNTMVQASRPPSRADFSPRRGRGAIAPVAAAILALAAAFPVQAQAALPAAAAPEAALTLDAAITAAKARSGAVKAKRLEITRADYAVKEALARGLPQLSLTGSGTYMTNPPKGISIKQGALGFAPAPGSEYPVSFPDQDYVLVKDTEHTYFKVQASLDQILWTWGKIEKATEIARLDAKAARLAETAEEKTLARDLSKAYFGAVMARESLGLLTEAKEAMDSIVKDQQSAFEAGTATKAQVLEAEAKAAQLAYQLVKAQESFQTALDGLEFWTGSRPKPESLVTTFRDKVPELDETALARAALESSTDLATLALRANQAKLGRQIREASLMGIPDFSLNVTYDLAGQKVPFFGSNWTESFDGDLLVTLGMKVTLFDSLASVWRLEQAKAQEAEARTGMDEMTRSMGIQVRRLVDAARVNAALVLQSEAEASLSAERSRMAELSLGNGTITRSEASGARVADISSRLSLLLARFQTESALLDLEYATGRIFPRN